MKNRRVKPAVFLYSQIGVDEREIYGILCPVIFSPA